MPWISRCASFPHGDKAPKTTDFIRKVSGMVVWPRCAFSSKLNHDRNTWEIVYLMVPASQNDLCGEESLNIPFESIVPERLFFLKVLLHPIVPQNGDQAFVTGAFW